jgi:dUTP pyrophosphatase
MKINDVRIILENGVDVPVYSTEQSVGFDLRANKILKVFKGDNEVEGDKLEKVKEGFLKRGYIKLRAFERVLFGTGIKVELPEGIEMQIRPRSGMALKQGITVLNSPGTIDPDYRGEIGIIAYNSTPFLSTINLNDRVAQGVLKEYVKANFIQDAVLTESDRGEGGFGSTGKE